MKVVVTGTNEDPEPLRNHVRTKAARKRLAERFKAPHDDLRLVIVCDMWLTGFDCPPAHTMYLDKPLAGHNLMQAIARVNRVYGGQARRIDRGPAGPSRPVGRCARDLHPGRRHGRGRQEGAERGCACHAGGLRETTWLLSTVATTSRRSTPNRKPCCRCIYARSITSLGRTTAGSAYGRWSRNCRQPSRWRFHGRETEAITPHLAFFQRVTAMIRKRLADDTGSGAGHARQRDIDAAVRQVIGGAIDADEVIDLFAIAGLSGPSPRHP